MGNGRCGARFGKTRCTRAGVYCSRWNWCGTSALHKRTHQALYDGRNCGAKVVKKRVVKKRIVKKAKKAAKKGKKILKKKIVIKRKVAKKAKKQAKKGKKVIKRKVAKKSKKQAKKGKKMIKRKIAKRKSSRNPRKQPRKLQRRKPLR